MFLLELLKCNNFSYLKPTGIQAAVQEPYLEVRCLEVDCLRWHQCLVQWAECLVRIILVVQNVREVGIVVLSLVVLTTSKLVHVYTLGYYIIHNTHMCTTLHV